jgi:hypothetical protein
MTKPVGSPVNQNMNVAAAVAHMAAGSSVTLGEFESNYETPFPEGTCHLSFSCQIIHSFHSQVPVQTLKYNR